MASSSSSTASTQTDSPAAALERFGGALRGHDARAAAACFAPEGTLLTPDGTAVVGAGPIHEVLIQLTGPRTEVEFELARVVRVGTVALCSQRWRHCRRGPGGVAGTFQATFLVGSSEQEGWQLLVAAPWGPPRQPENGA